MSHKKIAKALTKGATADIWYDAFSNGDGKAMLLIEKTKEAMAEAAKILESSVNTNTPAFNHTYDFAFDVQSRCKYRSDVTPDMLIAALRHRIERIEREDKSKFLEACDLIDTMPSAT